MQTDYTKIERIGQGGFGTVYKCKNQKNEIFAMKKIPYTKDEDHIDEHYTKGNNEIDLLFKLNHPNIIKIVEAFDDIQSNNLFLVLEYSYINLNTYIGNRFLNTMCEDKNNIIIGQILDGIEYLHGMSIIHCDLKPENICIYNDQIKIIDFGHAQEYPMDKYETYIQTLYYRAPELLLDVDKYDFSIDMWSLGCIIYFILTRETLFFTNVCHSKYQLNAIFKILGTPDEEIWPGVTSLKQWDTNFKFYKKNTIYFNKCLKYAPLIEGLLTYDPAQRLTITQVIALYNLSM